VAFIPLAFVNLGFTLFALFNHQGYVQFFMGLQTAPSPLLNILIGLGYVFITGYICCVFLTCRFLHRAARNLHTVYPSQMTTTPVSAWLWYFIPVVNFWKPYNALVEIISNTTIMTGHKSISDSRVLTWWVLFISSVFLGVTNIQLKNYAMFWIMLGFDAIAGLCAIPAAVLFIGIVKDLAKDQELLKHGGVGTVFD